MATYWLSFYDEERPQGQQFLGVVLIDLDDAELSERDAIIAVIKAAWVAKANPGGQVASTRLDPDEMDADARQKFAAVPRATLLSKAQLAAYGQV